MLNQALFQTKNLLQLCQAASDLSLVEQLFPGASFADCFDK
jgi:hypothetical protein